MCKSDDYRWGGKRRVLMVAITSTTGVRLWAVRVRNVSQETRARGERGNEPVRAQAAAMFSRVVEGRAVDVPEAEVQAEIRLSTLLCWARAGERQSSRGTAWMQARRQAGTGDRTGVGTVKEC